MEVHWEFRNGDARLGINHEALAALVNGEMLALSRQEIDFLILLGRANGRVVTREFLLSTLYPTQAEESQGGLTSCAARVRRKLSEMHPDAGRLIKADYGSGYKMASAAIVASVAQVA